MAGRKKSTDVDQYTKLLKTFTETYWDSEVEQAHELFTEKYPSMDDPHRVKKITFLDNSKRAKLQMLKHLAQSLAGINKADQRTLTGDEKEVADDLIKRSMERIEKEQKEKDKDE
jgi:hypothetical protein